MRVELDASKPLKPGVFIQQKQKVFWQQFLYKNLPSVCFKCGKIGHTSKSCGFSEEVLKENTWTYPLRPENVVAKEAADGAQLPEAHGVEGMSVPDGSEGKVRATEERLTFGPWIVTSRIR